LRIFDRPPVTSYCVFLHAEERRGRLMVLFVVRLGLFARSLHSFVVDAGYFSRHLLVDRSTRGISVKDKEKTAKTTLGDTGVCNRIRE
jgi:hypothetical protein